MRHLIIFESSTLIGFFLYKLSDDCISCVSTSLFLCLWSSLGDHSGGLGGHHVLCDGRSFLLQFHLLHPTHHCKCQLVAPPVCQSAECLDKRLLRECVNNNVIYFFLSPDWLLLHDQPLPGRHRHPVLGDQAAREPADEGTAGALHVQCQHSGLPLRTRLLLQRAA